MPKFLYSAIAFDDDEPTPEIPESPEPEIKEPETPEEEQ